MIDPHTPPLDLTELPGLIQGLSERMTALEARLDQDLAEIRSELPGNRAAIVVFSGDLDKVLAAFIIGTGAATMGLDVTMFFTFWGLSAIKERKQYQGKGLMERMMAMMTPGSSLHLDPSKMAFFGAGAAMFRTMMKKRGVASLEELMDVAKEMGIRFVACDMSVQVMGIEKGELRSDMEYAGVAGFLGDAINAKLALFV